MVLGDDGMDLFAAGIADMDFAVAPCILDALAKRTAHPVFGYEAVPDELMADVTNWLQSRHGWSVDEAHVLRAPNVLNTLAMAVNLFTNPGDGIIIQPPVFFDFADIIAENGRRLIENDLVLRGGCYSFDFVALEQLAAAERTRMLFLCNPHNPVGRVWSSEELSRIGDICRDNDVLVVADEIHGDITFSGYKYTPFAATSEANALNSITCVSPAKSFNIAACCGAFSIVSDEQKCAAFKKENSRLTVNKNNAFASVAMKAAYSQGGPWLDALQEYLDGNLQVVRDHLEDLDQVQLIEPEGTFLLWLDFRELGFSPDDLTNFLRVRAGWAITRGIAFGAMGAGFGRLNIACPRSRLTNALKALKNAVLDFRKELK